MSQIETTIRQFIADNFLFRDDRTALDDDESLLDAGLIDRLNHMETYNAMYGTWQGELTPAEVFRRNFYFCAIEDPSSFPLRHVIGLDHIMIEQDYPHIDSTWPRTQQLTIEAMAGTPNDEVQRICWKNAADSRNSMCRSSIGRSILMATPSC